MRMAPPHRVHGRGSASYTFLINSAQRCLKIDEPGCGGISISLFPVLPFSLFEMGHSLDLLNSNRSRVNHKLTIIGGLQNPNARLQSRDLVFCSEFQLNVDLFTRLHFNWALLSQYIFRIKEIHIQTYMASHTFNLILRCYRFIFPNKQIGWRSKWSLDTALSNNNCFPRYNRFS